MSDTGDGSEQGCTDETRWYRDDDTDGYGDPSDAREACVAPLGFVEGDGDCDDDDAARHPGAPELCDTIDNDCDGEIDEDSFYWTSFYIDADRDGYGLDDVSVCACSRPSGYVRDHGDCDDTDPAIHDGAAETYYDGIDSNCDGGDDYDADADGYGASGLGTPPGSDCDDTDSRVHPGADEICDGADQDCDALPDDSPMEGDYFIDADGDGYGDAFARRSCTPAPGYSADGGDCDDGDDSVSPEAAEVCDDGVDNDCSGLLDCEELACAADPSCVERDCDDGLDEDDDGQTDCDDEDCWGHGCTVARVRVHGGSMRSKVESSFQTTTEACPGHSRVEDDGSDRQRGELASVTGTLWVSTGMGGGSQSCAWWATDVLVVHQQARDEDVHVSSWSGTVSHEVVADCGTGWVSDWTYGCTSWEETLTSERFTLTRSGFGVEAGCGFYDSSFLPTDLSRAWGTWVSGPGWTASGVDWYLGAATLVDSGRNGMSTAATSWSTWETPALDTGEWLLVK